MLGCMSESFAGSLIQPIRDLGRRALPHWEGRVMVEAVRQIEGGEGTRLARLVAGDDWEGAVKFATKLAEEDLGPRASRQIEGWVTGLFERRWEAGKAVKEIWEEARGAAFTRLEAERAKATEEEKAAKRKAIEAGTEAVKEFR